MHISATAEMRVFLGWLPPFRHLAQQIGQWFLRKQQERLRVMSEKIDLQLNHCNPCHLKAAKCPTIAKEKTTTQHVKS